MPCNDCKCHAPCFLFHASNRSSMPPPQALLGDGPSIRTLSRGPVDLLPVALYILYSQVRLKCGG